MMSQRLARSRVRTRLFLVAALSVLMSTSASLLVVALTLASRQTEDPHVVLVIFPDPAPIGRLDRRPDDRRPAAWLASRTLATRVNEITAVAQGSAGAISSRACGTYRRMSWGFSVVRWMARFWGCGSGSPN